jgi:alkylation response protein AidB-like acyl-CoA dehydrogenase
MDKVIEARECFIAFNRALKEGLLAQESCLMHTYEHYFNEDPKFILKLMNFANTVSFQLEPLVAENNQDNHLPAISHYDAIGQRVDTVCHHPSYIKIGDLIYDSGLMHYLTKPGKLINCLSLFLLSSHLGEAGHNCPIACSAGLMRVLSHYPHSSDVSFYLNKFTVPSFRDNFTGAQFLTEIQGGSDVGSNCVFAYLDDDNLWRIDGEKWFCSNADADLILLTARFDSKAKGTQGLGLFLVPRVLESGKKNHYHLRRLKTKIGTRTLATAEIDFNDAIAYPVGDLNQGINIVMENVLHLSRLFNAFSVCGMSRRAYQVAYHYAVNRKAFGKAIINFPLVKENLATTKSTNLAMIASIFKVTCLQDCCDTKVNNTDNDKLLLRTLVNLNKYFTAFHSVNTIHHCIDILAGNGTIETFSPLPRLLRDSIVCENWEGTHYVLWMQLLKDIQKFKVDELVIAYFLQLVEKSNSQDVKGKVIGYIDDLRHDLASLKQQPKQLAQLTIQTIAKKMGAILALLCLNLEAQTSDSPNKAAAAVLFERCFFDEKISKDEHYLKLLDDVLN